MATQAPPALNPGVPMRREWGTAFGALRRLLANGDDTEQVFRIMRALNGDTTQRSYRKLLRVPGVDAVLIGPHDLSCSLGIPERYDDPRFEAAVLDIIRRARAAGVAAGIHWWGSPDRFDAWIEAGLNLIICSADITAMRDKLSADIGALRRKSGDVRQPGGAADNI